VNLLAISDAFWVSAPGMIAAIGAIVASIFGVLTARPTETIDVKSDKLKVTLDEVHVLTNSRALEADKKLTSALEQVSRLESLVTEMNVKAATAVTNDTLKETMRESIRVALEEAKTEKKKGAP